MKATAENKSAAQPRIDRRPSLEAGAVREEQKMELAGVVEQILRDCCCRSSESFDDLKVDLDKEFGPRIEEVLPAEVTDLKHRNELLEVTRGVARSILDGEASYSCCTPNKVRRVARKLEELQEGYLLRNHHRFLNDALARGTLRPSPGSRAIPVTPKFRKLIQAVLDNEYYFMQSYYHRALSSVLKNLDNMKGRKEQEKSRLLKTRIFEENDFPENMIDYYLDKETISYQDLKELDDYARKVGTRLVPRDIGRARKNIVKARVSIMRRAGGLTPQKKANLDRLLQAGFSYDMARRIAEKGRLTSVEKIITAYGQARVHADRHIHYFRVGSRCAEFQKQLQAEFVKHLNGTHYYLFTRNRLCSILKEASSRHVRTELKTLYSRRIESERFLRRLTTLHTFFKVKLFHYDGQERARGVPISSVTRMNQEEYEEKIHEVLGRLAEDYGLALPGKKGKSRFNRIKRTDSLLAVRAAGTYEEDLVLRLIYILDEGLSPDQSMVDEGWLDPEANLRVKVRERRVALEKKVNDFVGRYFRSGTFRDRFQGSDHKLVSFIGTRLTGRSPLEKGLLLQQLYEGVTEPSPNQRLFIKVIRRMDAIEPKVSESERRDAFLKSVYDLPALDQQAREFYFKRSRQRLIQEIAAQRRGPAAQSQAS